jgi:hypothetical protein
MLSQTEACDRLLPIHNFCQKLQMQYRVTLYEFLASGNDPGKSTIRPYRRIGVHKCNFTSSGN